MDELHDDKTICRCGHEYRWHFERDNLPSGRTGCANPEDDYACDCPRFVKSKGE